MHPIAELFQTIIEGNAAVKLDVEDIEVLDTALRAAPSVAELDAAIVSLRRVEDELRADGASTVADTLGRLLTHWTTESGARRRRAEFCIVRAPRPKRHDSVTSVMITRRSRAD